MTTFLTRVKTMTIEPRGEWSWEDMGMLLKINLAVANVLHDEH
jgi:hypothetical protein